MKTEISLKDLLDTSFTLNDNDEMVGSFTLKRINMIGDVLTQQYEEIERLNKENKILRENAEHNDKVVDKVNWENKRLNNIINELEKYCNEEIEDYDKALNNKVFILTEKGKESYEAEKMCFLDMLDKIQELKGSDKE